MSNAVLKSATLKARMARGSTIRCLGAHDALSARIGQEEGFEAIWASGLGVPPHAVCPMPTFSACTTCCRLPG
jgi:phosphoenolpyruvate phosphomutase